MIEEALVFEFESSSVLMSMINYTSLKITEFFSELSSDSINALRPS